MRVFLAAALAATSLATAASAQAEDEMVVTRSGEQEGTIGSDKTFTGTAYVEPVFSNRDPFVTSGGKVTFLPGARSNWHSHPAGQVLIVTEGTGWVQQRHGERIEMHAGDVIWTPPGVEHWHGATSTGAVTHYAIQQYKDGTNVNWLEPVSDADYSGE